MPVLPLLETSVDRGYSLEAFRAWYIVNRPEVILTVDEEVERLFTQARLKVPEEVAWAVLDWSAHYFGGRVAGMDQCMGRLGEAAADLVARKLWANQYGLPEENVAVHKGTKARGIQATPGFNPTASVVMTAGVADNQYNRVATIYNQAMQKAMDDELAELTNHMTEAMLQNGKVLEDNGISIK